MEMSQIGMSTNCIFVVQFGSWFVAKPLTEIWTKIFVNGLNHFVSVHDSCFLFPTTFGGGLTALNLLNLCFLFFPKGVGSAPCKFWQGVESRGFPANHEPAKMSWIFVYEPICAHPWFQFIHSPARQAEIVISQRSCGGNYKSRSHIWKGFLL